MRGVRESKFKRFHQTPKDECLVAHASRRSGQRYGIKISWPKQAELIDEIQQPTHKAFKLEKQSINRSVWVAWLELPFPPLVCFVYDRKRKKIATFLPREAIVEYLWYGNCRQNLPLKVAQKIIDDLDAFGIDLTRLEMRHEDIMELEHTDDYWLEFLRGFEPFYEKEK